MEALEQLKSTEPPQWLAPSESLSDTARKACSFLFASLKSHAPKSPFERLLVEGFDAEQIWQQIDLQSQPLLPSLRRQVAHFQKNPDEIGKLPRGLQENGVGRDDEDEEDEKGNATELAGFDSDEEEDDVEDEEDENEEDSEIEEGKEKEGGGIEDRFLKMNELEEYLEEDEAREYGLDTNKDEKKKRKKSEIIEDDEDESDGDEDEEEDEDEDEDEEGDGDDELGLFGFGEGGKEDEDGVNARYDDFFGGKKLKGLDKKSKWSKEDSGLDDEDHNKRKGSLSTHEKQLQQKQAEIDKMEKANLEPKTWTMQGEVTASNRPVNSALEVDLDFEHNIQPPPVITEEISASLEIMIKKRIDKGLFDDIQKVSRLPPKAQKESKEIDDNKSKKGLAEVYEEEYVQRTNPFSTPLSFSDELKKEASVLFKKLSSQLDALSHFHFAPKPVIEDMSIQTNVPALAMEEIAPLAVSDAAMLAPEEVYTGKGGDIKEEAELTKEDRARRRAKKKRKFKAEEVKRVAKKAKATTTTTTNLGEDDD